jgi:hypothetical protein
MAGRRRAEADLRRSKKSTLTAASASRTAKKKTLEDEPPGDAPAAVAVKPVEAGAWPPVPPAAGAAEPWRGRVGAGAVAPLGGAMATGRGALSVTWPGAANAGSTMTGSGAADAAGARNLLAATGMDDGELGASGRVPAGPAGREVVGVGATWMTAVTGSGCGGPPWVTGAVPVSTTCCTVDTTWAVVSDTAVVTGFAGAGGGGGDACTAPDTTEVAVLTTEAAVFVTSGAAGLVTWVGAGVDGGVTAAGFGAAGGVTLELTVEVALETTVRALGGRG